MRYVTGGEHNNSISNVGTVYTCQEMDTFLYACTVLYITKHIVIYENSANGN